MEFFKPGKLSANEGHSSNWSRGFGKGVVLEVKRLGDVITFTAGHVGGGTYGLLNARLPHNASFDTAIDLAAEFVTALASDDMKAAMVVAGRVQKLW